jgi:hypothetical protein
MASNSKENPTLIAENTLLEKVVRKARAIAATTNTEASARAPDAETEKMAASTPNIHLDFMPSEVRNAVNNEKKNTKEK